VGETVVLSERQDVAVGATGKEMGYDIISYDDEVDV
jgi:hypothetical protein